MNRLYLWPLAGMFAAAFAAACGDDEQCGPDPDLPGEVTVTAASSTLTFGELHAGPNNDCPPPSAPDGPTSITIQGEQTEAAATGFLTLCIPFPAQVDDTPLSFGDPSQIEIFDLRGQDDQGCTLALDRTQPLDSGSVTLSGFCDDGTHPDGFAMTLSGTLPFTRQCPTDGGVGESEAITVNLAGTAAVTAD